MSTTDGWLAIAAGDGRHDRDLVAVLDRRIEVLEKPDVFVVGEDVDEAPHLAAVVADAFLDARVLRLEARDEGPDGRAAGGDLFLPLGQLAERRRNANGGHGGISFGSSYVRFHISSKSDSRGPIRFGSGNFPTSGSCVFMPFPVTQMTTGPSSLPICPLSIRRIAAPSVTPPAVSAKIPSVSASRLIALTISSSLGFAAQPPEPMMVWRA